MLDLYVGGGPMLIVFLLSCSVLLFILSTEASPDKLTALQTEPTNNKLFFVLCAIKVISLHVQSDAIPVHPIINLRGDRNETRHWPRFFT